MLGNMNTSVSFSSKDKCFCVFKNNIVKHYSSENKNKIKEFKIENLEVVLFYKMCFETELYVSYSNLKNLFFVNLLKEKNLITFKYLEPVLDVLHNSSKYILFYIY
jgi:hypothetical protein